MEKREFKDKVYGELSVISRALANPRRCEIIELLAQGEFPVELIAINTGLSIANASQHLKQLKSARLVETRRKGNFILYRLSSPTVFKTWKSLRDLAEERIPSIDRLINDYRNSKANIPTITINSLRKKITFAHVNVVDVRPVAEYNAGHIRNSISIPSTVLKSRLKELSKKKEVITYCRGRLCSFADESTLILLKAGYKAARLDEGFPEWALRGLPVEKNPEP